MDIVDFHIHAIPPEVMGKAGEYGPEEIDIDESGARLIRVGDQVSRLSPRPLDKPYYEMFIEAQDATGITKSGLQITPLFYFHWVDPELGVAFSKAVNDTLAGYVEHYPDRLFFLATLPLQDIDATIEEVDRAVNGLGAKGVVTGTDGIAGRDLDDEYFFPLYAKLIEMGVPLFAHPGPYNIEDQEAEDKYQFSWIPGYQFRETAAVCHLVYGGVLDEFPELQVVIPHGGGTVPYLIGKLERLISGPRTEIGGSAPIKAKRPFRDYLRDNLYFDTFVEDEDGLRLLTSVMGSDRLLFGQHTGLASTSSDQLSKIRKLDLTESEREAILSRNAVELFGL